jgi:hypothetical protein
MPSTITTAAPTSGPAFQGRLQRKARISAALRPAGTIRTLRADREATAATVARLGAELDAVRAFAAANGREHRSFYAQPEFEQAQRRLAALDAELARREVRR